MIQIGHLRWWISASTTAANAVNYRDRQDFPLVLSKRTQLRLPALAKP